MGTLSRTSKYTQMHGETVVDAEILIDDDGAELLALTMASGRIFSVRGFEDRESVNGSVTLSVAIEAEPSATK